MWLPTPQAKSVHRSGYGSLVERQAPNLKVASSGLVARSISPPWPENDPDYTVLGPGYTISGLSGRPLSLSRLVVFVGSLSVHLWGDCHAHAGTGFGAHKHHLADSIQEHQKAKDDKFCHSGVCSFPLYGITLRADLKNYAIRSHKC